MHIKYIEGFDAFGEEMLKRDFYVVSDIRLISSKKKVRLWEVTKCMDRFVQPLSHVTSFLPTPFLSSIHCPFVLVGYQLYLQFHSFPHPIFTILTPISDHLWLIFGT